MDYWCEGCGGEVKLYMHEGEKRVKCKIMELQTSNFKLHITLY